MTAKEKAKDIYDKMKGFRVKNIHRKKCALICVDEILKDCTNIIRGLESRPDIKAWILDRKNYWQEVKQEIEIL